MSYVEARGYQYSKSKAYAQGNVLYKPEGEHAELTVGKKHYQCKNDGIAAKFEKAKFEGVSFRALGNEPYWTLEFISDKEAVLTTNLGQNKTHFGVKERFEGKNFTDYKMLSKHNTLFVRIENRRCFDTMVDRSYESTVYLNFDTHELRGCGMALF